MNRPTEKTIALLEEIKHALFGEILLSDHRIREIMQVLSAALAVEVGAGVDALAQEIRRVDGNHSLGAGALAEALMPFLAALTPASSAVEGEAVATGLMNGPLEEMAGYAPELFAERDQADWWLVRTDMGKVIFHGPDKARADRVAAIHGRTAEPLWSHPAPTPVGEWRLEDLTRPIFGIENRTAQEVFDIMADRIRLASPAPHQEGRADG